MTSDCRNDCVGPLLFPKRIHNRPGLKHIDYRIGTYSDFLESMLRDLNANSTLRNWTHRDADDPGIALLEGAAILGDILTFYQELYANEVYLRTADWRESIASLVQLLGYRLSPGVGGSATFAFEVKGEKPVIIPAGFAIKAQLEGSEAAAEFESLKEATAYPNLGQFNLYRPRSVAGSITAGINKLELHSVAGSTNPKSLASLELEEGDRIMLVPSASMFDIDGAAYSSQGKPEILIVSEVEHILDRTVIKFEGALTTNRGTHVAAYKIGRTFRHFGYNAPTLLTKVDDSTQLIDQNPTYFLRSLNYPYTPSSNDSLYYSPLVPKEIPLAEEVDDIAEGGSLICQGQLAFLGQATQVPFVVVRKIAGIRPDHMLWGGISGSSSVLALDTWMIPNSNIRFPKTDIRKLVLHETLGPVITLRAPTTWNSGTFTGKTLHFYGKYSDASALAGRRLQLEHDEDGLQSVVVTSKKTDISLSGRDKTQKWIWSITLDEKPSPFLQEDFDEEEPKVTVYGNLVDADQGKSEDESVLGSGDNREKFQTFKLPKSPLTYHTTVGESPPELPEVEIYVDDRLWKRVPTFFNRKPSEQIYIVREDDDDNSWVQFGDGKTGSRLPSGVDNVVAKFRTGVGAHGSLKTDTTVQAGDKLDDLDDIYLPGVVSGGDDAESGDNAREAAPGKIQSLDRLVSLADFEAEALAIAGVSKALASWKIVNNVPSLMLTILMATGRENEIDDVRKILLTYNRSRGPQRHPPIVVEGSLQPVRISAKFTYDPTYRPELVEDAIKEALGVTGEEGDGVDGSEGLFALRKRSFGQNEYASRVTGIIQNVEGVTWVETTEFFSPPSSPGLYSVLSCPVNKVLILNKGALQLTSVATSTVKAA